MHSAQQLRRNKRSNSANNIQTFGGRNTRWLNDSTPPVCDMDRSVVVQNETSGTHTIEAKQLECVCCWGESAQPREVLKQRLAFRCVIGAYYYVTF